MLGRELNFGVHFWCCQGGEEVGQTGTGGQGGSIGGVDTRQRGATREVTTPSRVQAPSECHTSLNLSFLPHEIQVLTGPVK